MFLIQRSKIDNSKKKGKKNDEDGARVDRSYSHIGISMREDNSYPLLLQMKKRIERPSLSSGAPAPPPQPCTACNSYICSDIQEAVNQSPFSDFPKFSFHHYQPFPLISHFQTKPTQLCTHKRTKWIVKFHFTKNNGISITI